MKRGIDSILSNIQGIKSILKEIESLGPQAREALNTFADHEETDQKTKKEVAREAIQFTIKKIMNDPNMILGVNEDDPPELKKEIYRVKARYYHDDGLTPDHEKFITIDNAYKQIK